MDEQFDYMVLVCFGIIVEHCATNNKITNKKRMRAGEEKNTYIILLTDCRMDNNERVVIITLTM